MAYCWKCGVELGEARSCPLCMTPVPRVDGMESLGNVDSPPELDRPVDAFASLRRKHPGQLWSILSAPFLTALLVVLSLSLRAERYPGWAAYAIGAVAALWALASLALVAPRAPLATFLGSTAVIAALLLYFDLINDELSWFLPLALPLIVAGFFFILSLGLIVSAKGPKGLHSIGFSFFSSTFLCIAVDCFLTWHYTGAADPRWSLVVGSVLVPFALLFVVLHYAFKQRVRFKRFFHF